MTDPRPLMDALWQHTGRTARDICGPLGADPDEGDPVLYSRYRRILSGLLLGTAQEVRILLDAMGYGPTHGGRVEYVRAYLRWVNADELGILARQHGVIL